MKTFDEYKQGEEKAIFEAVWQYVLDHSDITNEGVYFVKFHCNSKQSFADRIRARMKGKYRNGAWYEEVAKSRREAVKERGEAQSKKSLTINKQKKEEKYKNVLPIEEQRKALANLRQPKKHWFWGLFKR